MYLIYSAVSVNAVLTSDSGEDYKVRVTVDGEYLTEENKGADITIGSDGESYIMVTGSRLYEVLANSQYQRRQHLTMSSNSMDFGFLPSPSTFTRSAPDAFLGFARQLSSSFTGTHRHVGRDPRRSHLAGGYLVFRRPKWFHGGPGARVSGHCWQTMWQACPQPPTTPISISNSRSAAESYFSTSSASSPLRASLRAAA